MQRRQFLLGSLGAAAAVGLATLPGRLRAADRPFTFVSWGGALSHMEEAAFLNPFAAASKITPVSTSPFEVAKLKAMAEAKAVQWDLADSDGATVWKGAAEGFLERLDLKKVPNAAALDAGWVTPYGIATSAGASVIAWSTKAFPADAGPQSWADVWDLKRFPGPRGMYKGFYWNYEVALRALNVSRSDIYPVTAEKADMAFKKLAELKPAVTVWWDTGVQAPQLLSTGELAVSSAWSGRILSAIRDKAPLAFTYKDGIAWGNWWVIPKGTPYLDLAHQAIDFAVGLAPQTELLKLDVYGPTLQAAAAKADDATRKTLVMAPENAKDVLILNEQEGFRYAKEYEERWNQFLLG
jgi:putative spermidine/putrescine transport system substrate-binding protein